MITAIILLVLAIIFSGLYSGAETGVYTYNPRKGPKLSRFNQLNSLLKRPDTLVIACLVGTNLSVELATLSFKHILHEFPSMTDRHEFIAETIILVPILFIFAEVIPKVLMASKSNTLLPKMSLFLWLSEIIYKPFIWIIQGMVNALSLIVGNQDRIDYSQSRQRLKWVLEDAGGGVSSAQSRMVKNVMDLQGRQVASLMKPINSIELVEEGKTIDEFRVMFYKSQSNYLIVCDSQTQEIKGVVFMTTVLFADESKGLEELIIPIPEISNRQSVIEALNELKKDNLPVAKVMSDNGNVLGMVFTRQIVQEVVGELPIW